MHINRRKFSAGFTLVELGIVIVVLGILTGITVVGYGKWRESIAQKEVQSDLQMAASAMENVKNFGSGYPTSQSELLAKFKGSEGVTVNLQWSTSSEYCVSGASVKYSSIRYYITAQNKEPKSGNCEAAPVAPVLTVGALTATSITVSWSSSPSTTYRIKYGTGSPATTASCSSSPCVVSGLAPETTYKLKLVATNQHGSFDSSVVTGTTKQDIEVPAGATYALMRGALSGDGTKAVLDIPNPYSNGNPFPNGYDLWSCDNTPTCDPSKQVRGLESSTGLSWHWVEPSGSLSITIASGKTTRFQLVGYNCYDGYDIYGSGCDYSNIVSVTRP